MQPQLWTLFKRHIPYLVKALAAALEVWMAINLMMLLVAYFWYTECVSTKRIATIASNGLKTIGRGGNLVNQ